MFDRIKRLFGDRPAASGEKPASQQPGERRGATMGVANFLGPSANALLYSDCRMLLPVFGANLVSADASVPRCSVLFAYCNLDQAGLVSRTSLRVTDLAAGAGAQFVILASPTAPETAVNPTFVHSIAAKGALSAPLVITFDRNGDAFSKFFLDWFLRMRAGVPMFRAWVDIVPQAPNLVDQGPATMCVTGPPQPHKSVPQSGPGFTPLTDFLRRSFPGRTEAQTAALVGSPIDGRPGSKTWQTLFDEAMGKSANVPGAGQIYFQGHLRSGEKTIPVSTIAREFARISQGAFVTIFDTEAARAVGAIDFSQYNDALEETLRRIGYKRT